MLPPREWKLMEIMTYACLVLSFLEGRENPKPSWLCNTNQKCLYPLNNIIHKYFRFLLGLSSQRNPRCFTNRTHSISSPLICSHCTSQWWLGNFGQRHWGKPLLVLQKVTGDLKCPQGADITSVCPLLLWDGLENSMLPTNADDPVSNASSPPSKKNCSPPPPQF